MRKEYRRMMEQVALSDQKKEEIMDIIQTKHTGKRRFPPAAKLVLAAALAAGCIGMIAASLPAQVYHFIGGGSVTINPGTNTAYYDGLYAEEPVEVDKDGRVWFTADGQHLDITGQVDENTPYIYEHTDEASGQKGYLVVGGNHDNMGWMEWHEIDGDWFWHAKNCLKDMSAFSVGAAGDVGDDAIVVEDPPDDITPELNDSEPAPSGDVGYITEGEYTADDTVPYRINFRPWVEAANAQLAEMGVVAYEPQVD